MMRNCDTSLYPPLVPAGQGKDSTRAVETGAVCVSAWQFPAWRPL